MSNRMHDELRRHAVVIGASMGGLAAAAALATAYEQVTVLDRDRLPAQPATRRCVPQGRHAHGLQPGGLRALDELLPGLIDELLAAGVPSGDISDSCTWNVGGGRLARGASGITGIGVTRPFLEHRVRTRVAALPNVTIRDEVDVLAPLAGDARRVVGVEIANADGVVEAVPADLVVDASGKVSKLPHWLAALGFPAPGEELVHCKMGYLTQRWRLAQPHPDLVTIVTPAQTTHFAVLIEQEDGTHILTLGGLLDSAPGKSDYLTFARRLSDPAIAAALVGATPVGQMQMSHFPASRRRRYDKLRAFPAGLLALGDSIASFNPMYGQGMTVAALEAVALRDHLARGRVDALRFFATAHRIEDVAWRIAIGGDLRFDAIEGKRTPDMKIMNRYLDRLLLAARADPVLSRQFLQVAGFVARPESLFKPSVLWRVLVGGRQARRTGASPSAAQPQTVVAPAAAA